jgi:flagellar assembly protein FliH
MSSVADFPFGTLQQEMSTQQSTASDEFQPLFVENLSQPGDAPRNGAEAHSPVEDVPGEEIKAEELQRLLQESCDRAFADGRREAEESYSMVCRAFAEAIESVNGLRERIVQECEDDLLRLVMMIAKQVIRHELAQDRKILAQFVSEAVSGLSDQSDIVICFNPDDYRLVSANRQFYLAGVSDKLQVTIKPDDQVTVGGCMVETATGLVDARLETQLAEIFKRLMQERGHSGDEPMELPAKIDQYLTEQRGAEKYGHQHD